MHNTYEREAREKQMNDAAPATIEVTSEVTLPKFAPTFSIGIEPPPLPPPLPTVEKRKPGRPRMARELEPVAPTPIQAPIQTVPHIPLGEGLLPEATRLEQEAGRCALAAYRK